MNKKLLATVRYYFAQSAFNTSCHYKALDRLTKIQLRNKKIVIWIALLTLVVIIFQIVALKFDYEWFLDYLAIIGLFLTASSLIYEMYNKTDISQEKCSHKKIAEEYKTLRDQYMGLIEEIMSSSNEEDNLRDKRNLYQEIYSSIGKYAPSTTSEDYVNTQKGLGIYSSSKKEEFTWSDEEINKFLPEELRIKLNKSDEL